MNKVLFSFFFLSLSNFNIDFQLWNFSDRYKLPYNSFCGNYPNSNDGDYKVKWIQRSIPKIKRPKKNRSGFCFLSFSFSFSNNKFCTATLSSFITSQTLILWFFFFLLFFFFFFKVKNCRLPFHASFRLHKAFSSDALLLWRGRQNEAKKWMYRVKEVTYTYLALAPRHRYEKKKKKKDWLYVWLWVWL